MHDLVESRRQELNELCRRYRVQRLELFGSAADGAFNAHVSDLDFLVEFLPLGSGEHFDTYFGLLEALQSLFERPVDLIMTRAIKNPYFLQSVNRSRALVYAA